MDQKRPCQKLKVDQNWELFWRKKKQLISKTFTRQSVNEQIINRRKWRKLSILLSHYPAGKYDSYIWLIQSFIIWEHHRFNLYLRFNDWKHLTTTRQKSALSSKLSSQNQALFLTFGRVKVYHTISLAVFVVRIKSMGKRKLNYSNAKNLVVWGEILLFRLSSRDEAFIMKVTFGCF